MLSTMRAEFLKMRSVKSFYWTSGLVVFLSVGLALLMTMGTSTMINTAEPADKMQYMMTFTVPMVLSGFRSLGVMVIMIMSCLIITSEYRFGTIKPSLLVQPNRPIVALSKFAAYGLWSILLTLITLPLTLQAALLLAVDPLDSALSLTDSSFVRALWTHSIQVALMIAFAMGISLLVRHTAGAITFTLLYTLAVEPLVANVVPWVKDHIGPYLPLQHIEAFVNETPVRDVPWGATGSLFYAMAWVVVIFIIGAVVFTKRDA